MKYDYLVVGSGLYGAIFAHEAKAHGKSVLVVDKRPNIAGNIYTENIEGINVHKYGAHIFHTNNKRSGTISPGLPSSTALQTLPLPTIRVSCIRCPSTCIPLIKCGASSHRRRHRQDRGQRREITHEPQNSEEQAISLVGRDIYEKKLIKGYTEKQWGRDCKDLPAFIIKRLPCAADL